MHNADLDWIENNTPYSKQFGDIYFSRDNGLQESEHSYLAANQLPSRWSADRLSGGRFVIAETGFGTGLNFFTTWRAWRDYSEKHPDAWLHFISVEKYPLSAHDLAQSFALWPELDEFTQPFILQYPCSQPGLHQLNFAHDRLTLTLIFADAALGFSQLNAFQTQLVDAWYLDGFAPAKNPDMWSDALFAQIQRLSKLGATFSTFTAAGFIRRNLKTIGFETRKQKGFGCKREMTIGDQFSPPPQRHAFHYPAPWFMSSAPSGAIKQVAIIGGGLAGCATAYALANAGIRCTLFDAAKELASGASGNPIGVFSPPLNLSHDPISRFYLNSLLLLQRWGRLNQWEINNCGCLHLAYTEELDTRYRKLAQQSDYQDLVEWLDTQEIQQRFGLNSQHNGLWLKIAGQVQPAQLCHAFWQGSQALQVENTLCLNTHITQLIAQQHQWQLSTTTGIHAALFDAVIICNSAAATAFEQTRDYPIRTARGQLHWQATEALATPIPICGEGYITAKENNIQVLGSSFVIDEKSTAICPNEYQHIQQQLQQEWPMLQVLPLAEIQSRVSQRSVSRDHNPMVGPVVNVSQFRSQYADLSQGKASYHYANAPVYEGLYLNVAHGSRGISSCSLAAQMLSALLQHNPMPVDDDIYQRLHPARYFFRDARKGLTPCK